MSRRTTKKTEMTQGRVPTGPSDVVISAQPSSPSKAAQTVYDSDASSVIRPLVGHVRRRGLPPHVPAPQGTPEGTPPPLPTVGNDEPDQSTIVGSDSNATINLSSGSDHSITGSTPSTHNLSLPDITFHSEAQSRASSHSNAGMSSASSTSITSARDLALGQLRLAGSPIPSTAATQSSRASSLASLRAYSVHSLASFTRTNPDATEFEIDYLLDVITELSLTNRGRQEKQVFIGVQWKEGQDNRPNPSWNPSRLHSFTPNDVGNRRGLRQMVRELLHDTPDRVFDPLENQLFASAGIDIEQMRRHIIASYQSAGNNATPPTNLQTARRGAPIASTPLDQVTFPIRNVPITAALTATATKRGAQAKGSRSDSPAPKSIKN